MTAPVVNFSSTQVLEEQSPYAPPVENPLPRAVTRRNAYQLLDGEWRFDLDLDDHGLREAWAIQHQFSETSIWPSSVEAHMALARTEKQEQQDAEPTTSAQRDKVIAWYEREFTAPDRATPADRTMFQITFGACGYETRVWLNGHPLITIEEQDVHYGEFTSFSYELPEAHLRDVNRLTVRIEDSLDADIPRGKQESHIYKRGGIWYQTHSGAARSVWLEVVERNRLRTRIGAIATVEDRFARFNVTTRIHDPGEYTIRLSVYERNSDNSQPIATSDFKLRLAEGEKHQRLPMRIESAKLWCPESPTLYLLIAELIDDAGNSAQVRTHFGLR